MKLNSDRLSSKADVYSYGVLLLVIVSGRYNTNEKLPAAEQNLRTWAWNLYKKGKLDELVDKTLETDSCTDEACKYLKIGLLCTQERAAKRPAMSVVARMLKGEIDVHEPRAALLISSCFCGN